MLHVFLCVLMQVKMLVQSENGKLRAALVANLKSAVTASFLMLPESFSEEDLFLQIAGLSYAGIFFFFYNCRNLKKILRKENSYLSTVDDNQLDLMSCKNMNRTLYSLIIINGFYRRHLCIFLMAPKLDLKIIRNLPLSEMRHQKSFNFSKVTLTLFF